MATSVSYENVIDDKTVLNHLVNPTTARTAALPGLGSRVHSHEGGRPRHNLCVMSRPENFMDTVPPTACLPMLPRGKQISSGRWCQTGLFADDHS